MSLFGSRDSVLACTRFMLVIAIPDVDLRNGNLNAINRRLNHEVKELKKKISMEMLLRK